MADVMDRILQQLGPISEMDLLRLFAQLRRWRMLSFGQTPVSAA